MTMFGPFYTLHTMEMFMFICFPKGKISEQSLCCTVE